MPPVGLPSVSSSSDPAHGTWVGARRSTRHANSPRPLRLILSPRRFRHTRRLTSAVHQPRIRRLRRDVRRVKSFHTAVGAIASYLRISRGSRVSHHHVKDTAYPDAAAGSGPASGPP